MVLFILQRGSGKLGISPCRKTVPRAFASGHVRNRGFLRSELPKDRERRGGFLFPPLRHSAKSDAEWRRYGDIH